MSVLFCILQKIKITFPNINIPKAIYVQRKYLFMIKFIKIKNLLFIIQFAMEKYTK